MNFFLLFSIFFSPFVHSKVLVDYTYLKAKKPLKKSISLDEVKKAYEIVKKSTFNAPSTEKFFNDYLRFKLGVEVGLNEKSLVKSPEIDQMIVNPFLRQAFQQEVYKALAEQKLKNKTKALDKRAGNLSKRALERLYSNEPEFNIFFISVFHPVGPSKEQIQEAKARVNKIYSSVAKSKKPFIELVALYSDDKTNGFLNINRSQAEIPPAVYSQLKKMKNGQISRPIRIPSGYAIVKLNQKVPFSEANHIAVKANYFNKKRTEIFNSYFDSLKKDFRINFVNKDLVKTL
ncbi:MAG: peptidylprolyl isomerase [Bdellovibrionaceae bacterium]|nr:peptidylprolyl isomerase [Pseudobdellovibrionaceae bacterium]